MTNSSNNASWLKWIIGIIGAVLLAVGGIAANEISKKVDLDYYRADQTAIQRNINSVRYETLRRIENIEDKIDTMKDDTTKSLVQLGRIEERLKLLDKMIKENHNGTNN